MFYCSLRAKSCSYSKRFQIFRYFSSPLPIPVWKTFLKKNPKHLNNAICSLLYWLGLNYWWLRKKDIIEDKTHKETKCVRFPRFLSKAADSSSPIFFISTCSSQNVHPIPLISYFYFSSAIFQTGHFIYSYKNWGTAEGFYEGNIYNILNQ